MKRPKYKIDKYFKFTDRTLREAKDVYVLKQHSFWIFYTEVFRSVNRTTVEVLMYHLTKPR